MKNNDLKGWSHGSQVLDGQGNPLVVYRGGDELCGDGMAWFAESAEHAAVYGNVGSYYLASRKIFDYREETNRHIAVEFVSTPGGVDLLKCYNETLVEAGYPPVDEHALVDEVMGGNPDHVMEQPQFVSYLKSQGYDGMTVCDMEQVAHVTFSTSPDQIKQIDTSDDTLTAEYGELSAPESMVYRGSAGAVIIEVWAPGLKPDDPLLSEIDELIRKHYSVRR